MQKMGKYLKHYLLRNNMPYEAETLKKYSLYKLFRFCVLYKSAFKLAWMMKSRTAFALPPASIFTLFFLKAYIFQII